MTRYPSVTLAARTEYKITLSIVDRPIHNSDHCPVCQDIGSVVEAAVYLPVECGDGHLDRKYVECCVGCVVPVIDNERYLASDQTIQVEVYRGMTLRPF